MERPIWCDKEIVGKNVLPVPGCGFPCASLKEALAGHEDAFARTLNGEWRFLFCPSVDACPQGFEQPGFDDANFDRLPVPSNWQLHGYDLPIYSNTRYPLPISTKKAEIPFVDPARNPVGLYRRRFTVPDAFAGRRVLLQLDGVNSAAEIWYNGRFAGFCLSSFDAHRFDLTGLLAPGENLLAVKVYRWSAGSYLEDQDMWRLAGIFRDVWLVAEPETGIRDLAVKTLFPDGYENAVLDLTVDLPQVLPENACLQVVLLDPGGAPVLTWEEPLTAGGPAHLCCPVAAPALWSDELPALYRLAVTLVQDGAVLDARGLQVGFREVRADGDRLLLNGRPIELRGVNRHEFHPSCGHAVTPELNEADVRLLKQNNLNALRTSHYPGSRALYDLCDRYGVLVMSECNLESHGLAKVLPRSDPGWTAHCLDRMEKMVTLLKNHPCILFWSLGNESYMGDCFVQMRRRTLELDDTRLIHYEPDTSFKAADVYSQMYATVAHVERIGKGQPVFLSRCSYTSLGRRAGAGTYGHRPYLLCEYAHCMGNSLGNFADYWNVFRSHERLAGGFIWDFADQALYRDGRWCYGGDFGDQPNDGPFAFNGILRADRSPNPALYEVRQVLAPFELTLSEEGAAVKSLLRFACARTLTLRWSLCEDGAAFESGELPVPPLEPGETARLQIDYGGREACGAVDLVCVLADAAASPFAPAGRTLCGASLRLQQRRAIQPAGWVPVQKKKRELVLSNGRCTARVLRRDGTLASFTVDGAELLSSPLRPQIARAVTDNDRYLGLPGPLRRLLDPGFWLRADRGMRPEASSLTGSGILFSYRARGMKHLSLSYRMTQDGQLAIQLVAVSRRGGLPRAGVTFAAAPGLRTVRYFGLGPHENYIDRRAAALPGEYTFPAGEFGHDYLHPQENGNRTGVERFRLSGAGHALEAVTLGAPFEASAHPYTLQQLEAAQHADELDRSGPVTVNLDAAQRGVGGDMPAIALTKPPYCLHKKETYTLEILLRGE